MAKPSNPPIFDKDGYVSLDGMTLRDLFAAAALPHAQQQAEDADCTFTRLEIAQESYRQADAMLAERERGGE